MIGRTIGTYRLAELLGDGGLGPVYRGVDQATGREAAFRIFAREVSSDPMLAERLRAMSAVLMTLQHANIGAVYELLSVGPDLGMFIEYVPGASLDQVRTKVLRLDVNVAVSCAVQVLRALEHAHGVGVLHHALRPSNIRVTPQGTVKVMDFGIGHAFGANRKTREDRLLTVLAYLAPEQIQNQPGDARSDLYSIGVVLYELLTGRLPFDHKTEFALRQAHLHEPVTAPRSHVPALPEWLDQAVMRALAKNPAARFQNATECRAVLEAALGLSTSKEASVVCDVSGETVSMFEAAPPIPSAPQAGAESTVVMTAPPPPILEPPAALIVPGRLASTGPASSEVTQRPASVVGGKGGGSKALVAAGVLVLLLGAVGVGGFVWWRAQQQSSASDQAATTPAEVPPSAVEMPTAPAPAGSVGEAVAGSGGTLPPVSSVPSPGAQAPAAAVGLPPAVTVAPPPRRPAAAAATKPVEAAPPPPALAPPLPVAPSAREAPAKPPAHVVNLPDVAFRKVKLISQSGEAETAVDVVLMFLDDRLTVTPASGGTSLRSVSYREITGAAYAREERKRLGLIKTAQHQFTVSTRPADLLLRLDKDNVDAVLSAFESRTGKRVRR